MRTSHLTDNNFIQRRGLCCTLICGQGLKYNFQGGELFRSPGPPVVPSPPPVHFLGPCFNSIADSQIVNDRLDVIKHDFIFFNFVNFR